MPIELSPAASAANRRDLLDIAPRPDPNKRADVSSRNERSDANRSQRNADNANESRQSRDAGAARNSSKPRESKSDDRDVSDFERSLREDSQRSTAPVTEASSQTVEPSVETVDVALVEGEIALSLLLPAALGPEALANVQLDMAEQGSDPALAQAMAASQGPLLAMPQQAVKVAQGQVVNATEGDKDGELLAASQLGPVLPTQGKEQELVVMVKMAGEEVPVTMQVQPTVRPKEQLQQVAQALQLSNAQQALDPTKVDEQGNPLTPVQVAAGAAQAGLIPNQNQVNTNNTAVTSPTLSQIMQQATAAKGIGSETVQAPAAVAEAPVVHHRVEANAEVANAVQVSNGSGNGQISIEQLRPVATPTAAPPAPAAPPNPEMEKNVQQQVSRAIVQQMANGDRTLSLRLTPPQLGTVRIELVESRGLITVRFQAEDDNVRQALERQLPQLRQDLRAADAPVASLRMEQQTQAWHQGQHQHQGQQQNQPDRRRQGPAFSLEGGFAPEESVASVATAAPTLGARVSDSAVDARA